MKKLLLSVLALFTLQPTLAQLTDIEQLLADYIDLHQCNFMEGEPPDRGCTAVDHSGAQRVRFISDRPCRR